jgi:anti-anti-sigma regulatory factor
MQDINEKSEPVYHGDVLFALPPMMTLDAVDALVMDLKALPLDGAQNLILDAALVEGFSAAGLQIILSLEKTFSERGGAVMLVSPKESFVETLTNIGLSRLINQTHRVEARP